MTMGQLILQARQEAGLSQRQLAGEEITRNMLSALEHDCANPSISTLKYLSEKLCKPISYFLGEDIPQLPEYPALHQARQAYDAGEFRRCLELLEEIQPGEILAREVSLLKILAGLSLAEEAIREGRLPYARALLLQAEESGKNCPYFTPELERRLRTLQAQCPERPSQLPHLAARISADDTVLLLRAEAAIGNRQFSDAQRYLDAAEDRKSPRWNYLRGEVYFGLGQFQPAAECYHRAEKDMDLRQRLEICYRELEDYKMAYFYAKAK